MSRLLTFALLGLLWLGQPASADMYQDGSNANLPLTGTPTAAVCQVSGGKLAALPAGCVNASYCANIMAFGGVGDGIADNHAALVAALAAAPANQKCVAFPPGKFKFASAFSYTYPSAGVTAAVTLIGAGADTTQLIGPSGASLLALTLTSQLQSFHVRDLSLIAVNPCSTCTALAVSQTGTEQAGSGAGGWSDITRVSIVGSDRSGAFPGGVNYWLTGIDLNGVSNVNFDSIFVNGAQTAAGPTPGTSRGIYVHGDSGHIPVQLNFINSTINLYSRAFDYGPWVQGVAWVNGNLTGNMVGVYISSTTGQNSAQLSISNSQLNNCSNVYVPATIPGQPSDINYMTIADTVLIDTGFPFPCGAFTTSIYLSNSAPFAIVHGNVIAGSTGYTGVSIWGPSNAAGHVTNNIISNFDVGVDTTSSPLTTPSGIVISDNTLTGNTVGIKLGPNTINTVVSNNLLVSNGTNLVNNSGNIFKNAIDIPQDCSASGHFSFNGVTTGITYAHGYCQVASVGRQMMVDIDYLLTSKGAATGMLMFELPYAMSQTAPQGNAYTVFGSGFSGLTGPITANINWGTSEVQFFQWNSAGVAQVTDANVTNTMHMQGRIAYRAPAND